MYIYMVMNWGGYIFVINMVALHALGLVALGRHTTKLHRAYTLFYIIGTIGATHVPVVGWAPLKSLEQLGAFGVFLIIQIWEFVEMKRRAFDAGKHVNDKMKWQEVNRLRMQTAGVLAAVGLAVIIVVLPSGYFGPLSSRIRGLFVQHTRTGNPLVDSVAEHQPANAGAYWQYMHMICWFGPVGFCPRRPGGR
jgi:dolichyl-diphosphooligosaccharide--protein glycosyltransferase